MTTTTRRLLGGVAAMAVASAVFAAPATAATETPPCTASELSYEFTPADRAAGHRYADLKISVTIDSCHLHGAPTDVTFLDSEGEAFVTEARYESTETPYTVLTASRPAVVKLHWNIAHGPEGGIVPAAVSLKLPGISENTVVDWPEAELIGSVLGYSAVEPGTA